MTICGVMMEDGLLTQIPVSTQELFSQLDINNSYEVYLLKHNLKQELDRQLDKYISALNHDIKTPALAQIRALEHLLSESHGKLEPDQKDLLLMTLESCHEQYDIINNLINTLKYKKQEVQLVCNNFNIVELLKTNLRSLKKTITENENHIKFDTAMPEMVINADEEKLSEALYKLIKYVLKRSNRGSTISIETLESEEQQNIIIKIGEIVTSSNCGFTYTGNQQIYIGQESYNSVGTNLELRLVDEIISAHNGKLSQIQSGNSQILELKLPKRHIKY